MSQKKTGHHYIPNNSYLVNFTDESGKVWVLNEEDKIFATNPTNIFKEQHFYTIKLNGTGGSLVVENTLADIEAAFISIYRDKISQSIPLTIEEKAKISVFLAALHLRTKNQRQSMRDMLEHLLSGMKEWKSMFESNKQARDFSAAIPSSNGGSIRIEDVTTALENSDEFHSTSMMNNLSEIAQLIFDMDWQYLPAPDGEVFVTSDDPFRVLRVDAIKKYGLNALGSAPGLGWEDAEFTVPISSNLALFGARKGVGDGVLAINKKQLDQINYRTMMSSKEMIVASRPDILEEIRQKLLEHKNK